KNVEKYWPILNETLHFGDITIEHVSSKTYTDFAHRVFKVSHNHETRQVEQLHFLSWPDHGVPLYSQSLVPFLQKMLTLPLSSGSPLVVHCSAGVGRTGTILLSHICLKMAAKEGTVDFLSNLQKLREQRANLVDNVEQYKLAHLVVLECLTGVNTSVSCNKLEESMQTLFQNNGVSLQMQYLKKIQWRDEAMKTIGRKGKTPDVVEEKNRFRDIIPEIQGRVCITSDDGTPLYINAVFVDGFRSPKRFIVTQQPLPNTLADFWHLIDENDISTIISLNEINSEDETSCSFWPTSSQPKMNPTDDINLIYTKTLSLECYDLITIDLNTSFRKECLTVEIFSLKNWPSKTIRPESVQKFLTFWEDSNAASKKSSNVVVTCYDGVTASGLYVTMSFIIEKLKLEQSCDVCQAVRTVRHNRSQFVQEEEQFAFLYRAAMDYVNGFQSYADFI
ncbi:Y phosphatase and/or PTPlike phytase domain containing protein, partial [Asbolus verrucosus]